MQQDKNHTPNVTAHGSDGVDPGGGGGGGGGRSGSKKGRFTVQFSRRSSDHGLTPSPAIVIGNGGHGDGSDGAHKDVDEEANLTVVDPMEHKKNLYLYEEDMKTMPRVATFLNLMKMTGQHTVYPSEKEEQEAKRQPKKAKLGLLLGVYLPTIQHILGLLMFIRHAWMVGCAGVLEGFAMVFMCCLTTFVTSISLSAIATNGMVQSGGSYYMLSRNLGPECGGSIGICFYLANTFATTMYLLGAIEILLLYIAPSMAIFGDIHGPDPWNNFRLYGTVFMLLLTFIVAVGVKFVQMFAPISLACVIVSFVSIVIGACLAPSATQNVLVCFLGERLLGSPKHHYGHDENDTLHFDSTYDWCTKNETGDVWRRYCSEVNGTVTCDDYFVNNAVRIVSAIPGFASGVIVDNAFPTYMNRDDVTPGVPGDKFHRGEVLSDMTTGFVVLCAIYFPSVTGILTGANMSGDLKDPQKSLPSGTILAQLTCSFIFMLLVFVYGGTTIGPVLRDKFGTSIEGKLLSALLCWPSEWVVLIGAFASSVGAALQCLVSAPRLLQAIARDDIIPFLGVFKVTSRNNEPIRALIVTFFIAEIGIIIANIDSVAPIIDVFFLMCYMFVNVICALQTLLKVPNWRPRFKYYHWTLSVIGILLNFTLCIIAGWYYALSAFAIAAFIYKYIEYKGGVRAWGDGISGLTMSTAQKALLSLDEEPHTKNWRPQILVLAKLDPELRPKRRRLFSLASQLKAGKGLTVVASVIEGDYLQHSIDDEEVQKTLKTAMEEEKVKGFAKVLVCSRVTEGINVFIQTVGLGALKHNTVMIGWPTDWHSTHDESSRRLFIDTVRAVEAKGLALLVPRGIDNFPANSDRLSGTIDVWWVVHDGGMLILLSFLLQQHKVWKRCRIRIFTVAELTDNSIQIKKDLEAFLYQIRISAEVHIEEMYDSDISAYTVEKTMNMERRVQMMREMRHMDVSSNHRHSVHFHNSSSSPELPPADGELKRQNSSPSSLPLSSALPTTGNEVDKHLLTAVNNGNDEGLVHFTFTAASAHQAHIDKVADMMRSIPEGSVVAEELEANKTLRGKLLRMHTAVQLNRSIQNKSASAQVVIVNFPAPPSKLSAEENYMEYLDVLSEGLDRVLMVRGSGKEVVTMYS